MSLKVRNSEKLKQVLALITKAYMDSAVIMLSLEHDDEVDVYDDDFGVYQLMEHLDSIFE